MKYFIPKKYIKLLMLSILSRIIILSIGKLSSKIFIPFDKTQLSNSPFNFILHWDAINFYIVSKHGYFSEHILAFYPFYPYTVRFITSIFNISTLLSGFIISNLCFIINSLLLYHITHKIHPNLAYSTFLFFIFSPASILSSSLYTESIFMSLFLLGLPNTISFKNIIDYNFIFHIFVIFTRSNGLLFCIFYLKKPIKFMILILSFIIHNTFLYLYTGIPFTYTYIQKTYWEQGFLKFYTYAKNIPNTLVGLPF
ncbi:GPI mannosyltransferase, partial [Spraguea lophii 42_110]